MPSKFQNGQLHKDILQALVMAVSCVSAGLAGRQKTAHPITYTENPENRITPERTQV